jgi:hypothetical protein
MSSPRNWTCPHCNRPQTLTKGQTYSANAELELEEHKFGYAALENSATTCANPECGDLTVDLRLTSGSQVQTG